MVVERKFGWKPDLPDHRDYICKLEAAPGVSKVIDLRKAGHMPPVYDQGATSSCTGQAIAAAVEFCQLAQGKPPSTPSRLFIYFNERLIEGTINDPDAGATIRNGIKSVAKQGVPDEAKWPFDVKKVTVKPPEPVYELAKKDVVKQYSRVPVKLDNIRNVLTHNIPVVFGMSLFASFMSDNVAKSGMVPMPSLTEKMVGGHAMLIVGSTETHFIVRNSWGKNWGENGYCYIPHQYLTNTDLADDFWAIFVA